MGVRVGIIFCQEFRECSRRRARCDLYLTVYGPDLNGNFYQRFGPINSEYGHRRLNVLFTRAKKKVVLFTSMKPEEIQDEGKHWGVRALKGYIQFARDGHLMMAEQGHKECDSEFERWVLELLRLKDLTLFLNLVLRDTGSILP